MANKNPIEDGLKIVKDRIDRGWCRGHQAKDLSGFPCKPLTPEARVWSLVGAMAYVPSAVAGKVQDAILRSAYQKIDVRRSLNLQNLNDDERFSKQTIVEILDHAIRSERLKRHVKHSE